MKMAPQQKLYPYSAWLGSVLTKAICVCCATLLTTIANAQHFRVIKSSEGVEILENHKKVLFYQVRPKSVDGKYERVRPAIGEEKIDAQSHFMNFHGENYLQSTK